MLACLKQLSGKESLIGIISHVNGLKQKIGLQIQVKQKLGEPGAHCFVKLKWKIIVFQKSGSSSAMPVN